MPSKPNHTTCWYRSPTTFASMMSTPADRPKDIPGKNHLRERLAELAEELDELQRRFYARDQRALLLIFQAMDAAGKDGPSAPS